jgi:hypothetical protein
VPLEDKAAALLLLQHTLLDALRDWLCCAGCPILEMSVVMSPLLLTINHGTEYMAGRCCAGCASS